MFERIKHMLIKEFIQIFRDPKMKAIIFVMPILQVLIFGYAVTLDVNHIATGVYDLDNSVVSRELIARFENSGYFDITDRIEDSRQIRELIDFGEVSAVIQINRGFSDALRAGRTADLQLIVDGSDSNTAGVILDYSYKIVGQFSQAILVNRFTRLNGAFLAPGRVELETRTWFNENLESRNFYVPGVIAIVVMLITLMLTSMAVVREKEIGTIEQIMVTPITSVEFILGKSLPFALIGFANVVIVTLIGVFWFGVPIRGSLLTLFFATSLYIMTTLGIGLLISTLSRTQQQAMMSAFFFYFPAVLLSGFMFPIANMPQVIQWLTFLNPLRYYLVVIRGVFLKGIGAEVLWPQMVGLALLGIATLWLASRRFQKTLS